MGPLYLGKKGTFVNFRYINNLADCLDHDGVLQNIKSVQRNQGHHILKR